MATETVKTFGQRAEENDLPVLIDRDTIAEMGALIWRSVSPSSARTPDGVVGPGLLAQLEDDKGRHYQSFIGNVALLNILATPNYADDGETVVSYTPRPNMLPMKARIIKSGRTWVFSD